jgi:hypothetical protein
VIAQRPSWINEITAQHAAWRASPDGIKFKRYLRKHAQDLYERMSGWPKIHELVPAEVMADWIGPKKSLGPAALLKWMPQIVERYQSERSAEPFERFVNRLVTSGQIS